MSAREVEALGMGRDWGNPAAYLPADITPAQTKGFCMKDEKLAQLEGQIYDAIAEIRLRHEAELKPLFDKLIWLKSIQQPTIVISAEAWKAAQEQS